MKINTLALLLTLAAASAAWSAEPLVKNDILKLLDGSRLHIEAVVVDYYPTKTVLNGKAYVKVVNATGSETFEGSADKIVITLMAKSDAKQLGQGSIKAVDLIGSPHLTYMAKDASTGILVKTSATSTSATYDGKERKAYLKGNVKIVRDDPAMFEGPAVMTGDEATVNLNPKLGPDEPLFSIKSSPGISRMEVTRKAKEVEKPKK